MSTPIGYLSKVLLVFIAVAAYGQSLMMYFWQDDYTIYYTAMQDKLFAYPYQVNTLLVKILIPFFGLSPVPYYALAIVLFLGVVFSTYYFLHVITQNTQIAFWGAAVTASGYIGQGAVLMFLGTGIAALPALIFFLLSLSFLIQHLHNKKLSWIIGSLVLFFLAIETAPHRHATAVISVLGILILQLKRENLLKSAMIALPYMLVTIVELFAHPTKLMYYYETGTMGNVSPALLASLRPSHIGNLFGSFWNTIVPSSVVPLPATISAVCGLVFVTYAFLKLRKGHANRSAGTILMITIFGSMLTFFLSKPDTLYESDHRYLLSVSYASSIIPILFWRKGKTNALAISLCIGVVLLHLSAGVISQYLFVHRYSIHARNIFTQLTNSVQVLDDRESYIHIEASTYDLNLWAGDALRVGTLPSETAVAVHFNTTIDDFWIVDTVKELPDSLRGKSVEPSQVYTYLYDGSVLHDTSLAVREIMMSKPVEVDRIVWQVQDNKHIYLPHKRVSSQWPMTLSLIMRNESFSPSRIHISWEYDTSGHPVDVRSDEQSIDNGDARVTVQIPGGGTVLSNIQVEMPEDTYILESKLQYRYE